MKTSCELEDEDYLQEGEDEDFLGDVVGGLLGESEEEYEAHDHELEGEEEDFLGDVVGGLLGESEDEFEYEDEDEWSGGRGRGVPRGRGGRHAR